MNGTDAKTVRALTTEEMDRVVFVLDDGYFMRNEYDDKNGAADYKTHVMKLLEILEKN